MGPPENLDNCISRDEFNITVRHMEDKLSHLDEDRRRAEEEHRKELTYKTNMNRQLVIWLGVITFGIIGIMWADLNAIQVEFQLHEEELYHRGAGHLIEENKERIEKVFCKVFGVCGG